MVGEDSPLFSLAISQACHININSSVLRFLHEKDAIEEQSMIYDYYILLFLCALLYYSLTS